MSENDRHKMVLVTKDPDGVEEWMCPTCGRRFLMQWPPKYKRTILEAGDENAAHMGVKGKIDVELNTPSIEVSHENDYELPALLPEDEEYLLPWKQWMDNVGFENLWNTN